MKKQRRRRITMLALVSTAACLLLTTNAQQPTAVERREAGSRVVGADSNPHPLLVALESRLKEVIHRRLPQATLRLEGVSLTAQYQVRTFMVHTIYRDGQIDERAHEESGPNSEGFLLNLRLETGEAYEGPLELGQSGQTLRRPYWQTFVNDYPLKSGGHIWLTLSYGVRFDDELLEQIKQAVAAQVQTIK